MAQIPVIKIGEKARFQDLEFVVESVNVDGALRLTIKTSNALTVEVEPVSPFDEGEWRWLRDEPEQQYEREYWHVSDDGATSFCQSLRPKREERALGEFVPILRCRECANLTLRVLGLSKD